MPHPPVVIALTPERAKFVEDNIKLVNSVLNKHYPHLAHQPDFIQQARLFFCDIVARCRTAPEECLEHICLTLHFRLITYLRRQYCDRRKLNTDQLLSLDYHINLENQGVLLDLLEDTTVDVEGQALTNTKLTTILSSLKPNEAKAVKLILAGFTQLEVSKLLPGNRKAGSRLISRIRKNFQGGD